MRNQVQVSEGIDNITSSRQEGSVIRQGETCSPCWNDLKRKGSLRQLHLACAGDASICACSLTLLVTQLALTRRKLILGCMLLHLHNFKHVRSNDNEVNLEPRLRRGIRHFGSIFDIPPCFPVGSLPWCAEQNSQGHFFFWLMVKRR
jgi:hypothetical protein